MNHRTAVDCFLAFDELDLACRRIHYLSQCVEKFYIGVASHSFSGIRREEDFFLALSEKLPRALREKTSPVYIDVPVDILNRNDRWAVEQHCRETLLEIVSSENMENAIIFSDLDEIPSKSQITAFLSQRYAVGRSLPMVTAVRWPNLIALPRWKFLLKPKIFIGSATKARLRYRFRIPIIFAEPGFHFTYLGMGPCQVYRKHKNFSHQELDRNEFSNAGHLRRCDSLMLDHRPLFFRYGNGLLRNATRRETEQISAILAQQFPTLAPAAKKPAFLERLSYSFSITRGAHDFASATSPHLGTVDRFLSTLRILSWFSIQFLGLHFIARALRRMIWGDSREGRRGLWSLLRGKSISSLTSE